MRNTISILSLLLIITLPARSQNTLKMGLSYARFGTDGQNGVNYYTEYNHFISPTFYLAPSLQMAYGTKGKEFPYYLINKFTSGVDINLFYSPLQRNKVKIKIGVGPSLRYFSGRNLSDFHVSADDSGFGNLGPDDTYNVPFFYPNDRLDPNYVTVGYSGVIEGEINLSSHWIVGLRASYQGYSSHDRITSIGINSGFRF